MIHILTRIFYYRVDLFSAMKQIKTLNRFDLSWIMYYIICSVCFHLFNRTVIAFGALSSLARLYHVRNDSVNVRLLFCYSQNENGNSLPWVSLLSSSLVCCLTWTVCNFPRTCFHEKVRLLGILIIFEYIYGYLPWLTANPTCWTRVLYLVTQRVLVHRFSTLILCT